MSSGDGPSQASDLVDDGSSLDEVLMRLENGKDRGRGPDVTPLRSASAE